MKMSGIESKRTCMSYFAICLELVIEQEKAPDPFDFKRDMETSVS